MVLTTEGKIVGFQPTSRVAVNYWAANPLAKQLYGGKNLSPGKLNHSSCKIHFLLTPINLCIYSSLYQAGLLETGLRIKRPNDVVVIELLMSVKTDTFFALARPVYYSTP